MEHMYDCFVEVIEQQEVGREDGTPVTSPVTTWTGPGRKDDPTEAVAEGAVATKVSQRTYIFVPVDCPVTQDAHVAVTDSWQTRQLYRVQTVEKITSPFYGPHHLEIGADRMVNG